MTEEQRIEPAVDHFGQIELGFEPLGIISLADEICGFEIDVRVERDDPLVDLSRFLNHSASSVEEICATKVLHEWSRSWRLEDEQDTK